MKKKVLIAEREGIIALDIKYQLEKQGYSVSAIVNTGEKTISAAKKTNPDLIIVNLNLSDGINGIEAIKHIRSLHDIPVIFISSQSRKFTHNILKKITNSGYLLKPFQTEELHDAVNSLI